MRDFSSDHRWLSINTATLRKQWALPQILDECARAGIRAVSPWRDQVAAAGLQATAAQCRALGLELSGYCRGGMFPALDQAARQAAFDDNRRAVDEACTLNAPCLILVVGGLPGGQAGASSGSAVTPATPAAPRSRDLAGAREQVREGIAQLLPYARAAGMPLAIEPLHPMYAAERACINTLRQALDLCALLEPLAADKPMLGVAVDAYHVWWDPELQAQIERAGRESRLFAYHVCDWLVPTTDLLNDRGMMGDGVIDLPRLRGWVEASGYSRYSEVEIFSERWWALPGEQVLQTCIERHRSVV